MPELPEIENIKNNLIKECLYKYINFCIIRNYNFKLRYIIPNSIINIKNKYIKKIKRRGRYLILILSKGNILIHLGMTGKFLLLNYNKFINKYCKHTIIDFILKDNNNYYILRYIDYRKLGYFLWFKKYLNIKLFFFKKIGIEPLKKSFNTKYLFNYSYKSNSKIKNLLMNNLIVTGIGNIYVNEILFHAKINPNTKSNLLKYIQINILIKIIKSILLKSIKLGGSITNTFTNSGNFSFFFKVYKRKNKKCLKCKHNLITYQKISGRGTYFCNNCQL